MSDQDQQRQQTRTPVPPFMDHYAGQKPETATSSPNHTLNVSTHSQPHSDSDVDAKDAAAAGQPQLTAAQEKQVAKEAERKELRQMARKETRHIQAWRLVLMLLLLSTGAMVATGTFLYIRNKERDEMLASYKVFTDTVKSASDTQFSDFSTAMFALAQTITVAGISASNDTSTVAPFPFVRVPMFEVHGSHARKFSGVEVLAWSPLVTEAERPEWNIFCQDNQKWFDESNYISGYTDEDHSDSHAGHDHGGATSSGNGGKSKGTASSSSSSSSALRPYIWYGNRTYDAKATESPPGTLFAPTWQVSPPPFSRSFLNYDALSEQLTRQMLPALEEIRQGLVTRTDPTLHDAFHHHRKQRRYQRRSLAGEHDDSDKDSDHHQETEDKDEHVKDDSADHPHSTYLEPVFSGLDRHSSQLVGFISSTIAWDYFLSSLLPEDVTGMVAVLLNSCGEAFTFVLDGKHADFVGKGDHHDREYDSTRFVIPVISMDSEETRDIQGHCTYEFALYFSSDFRSEEKSPLAVICTTLIAIIFALMAGAFYMYDRFVDRRNTKIQNAAATSGAFISTLFPSQVKKRLLADEENEAETKTGDRGPSGAVFNGRPLGIRFDDDGETENLLTYKTKPIADLFTETTILFADLAGFSAWSSVREPAQVFMLLETLFRSFDEIAKKRNVFKVETVGDCYVAVAGLPDVRSDHALVMARFARECMLKMRTLVRKLEVNFGPDTGDLAMRMGMHSGPVTAGVLRGDRSRFQLFGDTMNMASRMESSGQRDKIHVSKETADLLIAAGKEKWLTRRVDAVYSKDGELVTFWLDDLPTRSSDTSSQKGSSADTEDDTLTTMKPTPSSRNLTAGAKASKQARTTRLVKWSEDVLLRLLKQIVARRHVCPPPVSERNPPNESRYNPSSSNGTHPVDEITDRIALPRFRAMGVKQQPEEPENVVLDPAVAQQLRRFVSSIADMYQENDFHNFEHASHVVMSVVKLMSRIVDPPVDLHTSIRPSSSSGRDGLSLSSIHDKSYGIASDPLTQFACVLAALVHDVDHQGVPNAQLVREQNELAMQYSGKSVAEQNSFNLSWNLLMSNDYVLLRRTIYETDSELKRFRQILVNATLATDLFDVELKEARQISWERAFSETALKLTSADVMNRKATMVINHLLQASDIAHTMQHWHVYRKWNEKYFLECYAAFVDGRADKSPAEGWYEGELSFFNHYVIPLAHKLKECGVFGVSSDEYLNYALRNRSEWEKRGRDLVDEMVRQAQEAAANRSMF